MPKPREAARLQRRAARDLANRNVLAALDNLAASPPPELPPHLATVYRNQVLLARARRPGHAPRDSGGAKAESPPDQGRNGA